MPSNTALLSKILSATEGIKEGIDVDLKRLSDAVLETQSGEGAAFISQSVVFVDYPISIEGEQYRPNNIVVNVLDTESLIEGLTIAVASGDVFDGDYNTVGVVAIDSMGRWTNQVDKNAYRKNDGTDTYCVYDYGLESWVFIVTDLDHNNIGADTGGDPIDIFGNGQLPVSFGSYDITNNMNSIDSDYFSVVDVFIEYHTSQIGNSFFTVDFGGDRPSGFIYYR